MKKMIDKTISLYAKSGWKKWFAKIRFWDAPFEQVEKIIPKRGVIVDLGCGEGIFTNFLALSSNQRRIVGVERDRERYMQADKGIRNVKFVLGDVLKTKILKSD